MILLVNKDNLFNEDDLNNLKFIEYERFDEKIFYIERETLYHFEMLQAHLKIEGIEIEIDDAYRSLETQENIFLKFMKKYGIDYASSVVAMPGTSEHHTGQAIDIIIKKDGKWLFENEDLLKEDKTLKKIHKVLKYFGFILRYPKGKEDITGYPYEPWHIRYIGVEDANKIGNLTLEEYLKKEGK